MEYANVEIRLNGSLTHTVNKEVSAPEILILRQIHGDDAVNKVVASRVDSAVTPQEERKRLDLWYGPDVVKSIFGPNAGQAIASTLVGVGAIAPEPVVEAPKKGK